MENESHISSVIVYVKPEFFDKVHADIAQLDDVEVAAHASQEGKLVAVIDTPTSQRAEERIHTIKQHEGVMSAALVYHHVETNQALDALIESPSPENIQ